MDQYVIHEEPLLGKRTVMLFDPDKPDEFIIQTQVLDVSALLDRNKEIANINSGKRAGDVMLAASIPQNIYWDWQKQGITEDTKYMNKLLNGDYKAFKTTEKKL